MHWTSFKLRLVAATIAALSLVLLTAAPAFATPKVTAIAPSKGPAVGGTTVTITGEGFEAGSTVKFGSVAGASVTVNSSTSISVKSPSAAGTVPVTVTNATGTSFLVPADEFSYQWLGLNTNSGAIWADPNNKRKIDDFTQHNVVYDRGRPLEMTAGNLPSAALGERLSTDFGELWPSVNAGMTPMIPIEFTSYSGGCEFMSLPESHWLPTGTAIDTYVTGFIKTANAIREMYPGKKILFEAINEPWCAADLEYDNPEKYAEIIAKLLPAAKDAGIPLEDIYVAATGRACKKLTGTQYECSFNTWVPRMYAAKPQLKTEIKGWYFHPYGPPTGTFNTGAGGIEVVPTVRTTMTSGQNNIIVSEIGFCTPDVGSCGYTGGYPYVPNSAQAAADLNRVLTTASAYYQAGWLKGLLFYNRHAEGWAAQLLNGEITAQGKSLNTFGDISLPAQATSPAAGDVPPSLPAIKNKVLGPSGALREQAYQGTDHAIWIRYVDAAGPHTERLGGQAAAATSPAILREEGSEMKQWIYYRGSSGTIWQWEWNGSSWSNTSIGGTPRIDASPMAIRDPATGKRWVYFPNTSGTASQAEWTGSAWSVTFVSSAAVKSGTNVSVVADFATGNKWLYYTRITSGWIGEVPYSGGHWLASTLIGGPTQGKASASALRDAATGNRFVYFVDSSGKLRELAWNGTAWTDKELTEGARAESTPSAVGNATRRWVYYDGADGRVRWRSNAGVVGVGSASVGPQSNPSASLSSYTESGSTVTIHTGSYVDPQALTHTRIDKFAVSEGGGTSEPAVTEGEPQAISLPAITTLEPHLGQAVSASTGTWEGAPAVLSYQWQRCETGGGPCTDILGATASTYTPVQADVGHPLVFSVTAQNNEGGGAIPARSSVVTTAAVQNLGSFGIAGWENGKFRRPVDAAVNASGNIWIVDLEKQYLQLFSPTGTYLGRLGEPGNPEKGLLPGQFYDPDCIAIDAGGNIWVGDESGRIQKFNSSGQVLLAFGKAGPNPGEFGGRGVKDIAIDSNGNIWASDYSSHIQEFSPTGQYLKTVGSEGFEPGQFIESSGMDIGPDGRIWVIDHYTNRINVFSSTGAFLYRWGTSGTNPGQISEPDGLEVDTQGNVWVEEEGTSRVQEFNPYGELMAKFGSFGSGSGQFDIAWPMSLTSDSNGNLWIPDGYNSRIQHWKYTP